MVFTIPGFLSQTKVDPRTASDLSNGQSINAWVQIDTTGRIRIYSPAAEMGQGSMTALAIIIAEEMDADWNQVDIEHSPIEPSIYGLQWNGNLGGPMITVGSRTVRGYYKNLRHAGAQVRYSLIKAVADHQQIDVKELSTGPSVVTHPKSGQSWSYAEVAGLPMPTDIPDIPESAWKDPSEFRLIGKQIARADIPDKVDGTAVFAMDIQLPDMVYASMQRSPIHGETPKLLNGSEIEAMPGVLKIVHLDHGIAVIANSYEEAVTAKKALDITWSEDGKAQNYDSIKAYDHYSDLTKQAVGGQVLHEQGVAPEIDETSFARVYKNDFAYHAQMEPLNAVVSVDPDGHRAEAWVGSQSTDGARKTVARALGLEVDRVVLHPCFLGGGFGRRSMSDFVEETALLAKEIRRPVKLIWSREDDIQYGAFRPISVQRIAAKMHEGHISSWDHHIAGTGGGLMTSGIEIPYYDIPNQRITRHNVEEGVRTKHWRSVGHGPNKFAIESFIDELCVAHNQDPLEVRRRLLAKSPRELHVLNVAADMCQWSSPPSAGRARGIAFGERSGALVAGVAEISLQRNRIKVHHFWCAMDAGVVVHRNNAEAQLEGGIIFGLSSLLKEQITFKEGRVVQSNFHNYQLLRMSEAPENIEISIIDSNEAPMGIGEASLPVVGGAVANAFLALTGKAIRHMPFTPDRVKEALS